VRTLILVSAVLLACSPGHKKTRSPRAVAPTSEIAIAAVSAPPGLKVCAPAKRGSPLWLDAGGKRIDSGLKAGMAYVPPRRHERGTPRDDARKPKFRTGSAEVALPETSSAFYRDYGISKVLVWVDLCVSPAGYPEKACFVIPPGHAEAEQRLLDTIAEWRFESLTLDDKPCHARVFKYEIPAAMP
jgi:hypothetical protein